MNATYSPEDNKLRLYPSQRLAPDVYERVRAAGFRWAPKQELFVAPMWTVSREDLLIELCGEIGDEDTSLVDRAEERAERFDNYSRKRASDAHAAKEAVSRIADNIPFGQPILVGHHSERHARKDAEKIESGMRRSIKMWETSGYWASRAAGAIRAAKYKELPGVRARRIKGLEADKRSRERDIERAETFTKLWSVSLGWDPEVQRLTREQARAISNHDMACDGMCFPLEDFPRNPPASQYEGALGIWSALGGSDEEAIITPEQARDFALRNHAGAIKYANRWLTHINNRLAYERAMLGTEDGLPVGASFDLQVGSRVLVGKEWYTVTKVNRKDGEIVSVSTNSRYGRVKGIGEISDHQAPTAEQVETVKAATKQLPLINYRAPGHVEMTSQQWKDKTKYSGSSFVASFNAEGGKARSGMIGEGVAVYRQRSVMGKNYSRIPVFLTDAKETFPPKEKAETVHIPMPTPATPHVDEPVRRHVSNLDELHESMFYKYDSGKLKAGIKYEYVGEGWADCYQFDTVESLIKGACELEKQPRLLSYKIVTHSGEYKNMRTLYAWSGFDAVKKALEAGVSVVSAPQLFPTPKEIADRMLLEAEIYPFSRILEPSAGTGNLLDAIYSERDKDESDDLTGEVVAIEINPSLADRLKKVYPCATVINKDFLECNGDLGMFDVILMNPPFEDASDIKHIVAALAHLSVGGRLVALCADGPRQRFALQSLVDAHGGVYEPLPEGSFKAAGTNVNTAMVVLTKQPPPEQQAL